MLLQTLSKSSLTGAMLGKSTSEEAPEDDFLSLSGESCGISMEIA